MGYETNIQGVPHLIGKIAALRQIDQTLTKPYYAADAKVTGDRIRKLQSQVENIDPSTATGIAYNNTASGLEATNMQDAIDEVAEETKKGKIFEGTIGTKNFNNGYSAINKNHSESVDYGTQLIDYTSGGNSARIDISGLYNTFNFVNSEGVAQKVHHEGTKPFGNYAGNGSATSREIDTKGFGRLIIVYNIYYFSFVTPEGALVINLVEGTNRWIESTKAFFLNGKLGLATDNAAFNQADTTYYYQVI